MVAGLLRFLWLTTLLDRTSLSLVFNGFAVERFVQGTRQRRMKMGL